MKRKIYPIIFMIMVFSTTGCVKDTYDMNKLIKKGHLSPTIAVSAIKGIVSFSDMVKAGDTVLFGQDKSVKLIFKIDSVIDLSLADFISLKNIGGKVGDQTDPSQTNQLFDYSKSSQLVATISPDSIDFKIDDILNNNPGTFGISSPSITINYSNPFVLPVELEFTVTGKRKDKTVDLNLTPFSLNHPAGLTDPSATGSIKIDKNNSSLQDLVSLPPGKLYFSGKATMNLPGKTNENDAYVSGNSRLIGSLEVEIPLEFRMNNFQFTDTIDNFLKDAGGSNSNIKPEDFKLLRVKLIAKNGFPLGVSVQMSLNDTTTTPPSIKTIDATELLNPAPVGANGKSTGVTETTTNIELTQAFFSSIPNANKIFFKFTLNTTNGSTQDIKIYSDYTIDYNAALVAQPDITFN